MAEQERELLGIDPTTVIVGLVRPRSSFSTERCPLAKGRDGSWYVFSNFASTAFNLPNRDGSLASIRDFPENTRRAYDERFDTPEAREQVVLGVAASVVPINRPEIQYHPHDLGLWQKVGEYDGLDAVAYVYTRNRSKSLAVIK